MANAKKCNTLVRFWSPEHQMFFTGYMTSYHDESSTANVNVQGGPTFWIVPYRLIRRTEEK